MTQITIHLILVKALQIIIQELYFGVQKEANGRDLSDHALTDIWDSF